MFAHLFSLGIVLFLANFQLEVSHAFNNNLELDQIESASKCVNIISMASRERSDSLYNRDKERATPSCTTREGGSGGARSVCPKGDRRQSVPWAIGARTDNEGVAFLDGGAAIIFSLHLHPPHHLALVPPPSIDVFRRRRCHALDLTLIAERVGWGSTCWAVI